MRAWIFRSEHSAVLKTNGKSYDIFTAACGRGLWLSENKDFFAVLDFIGQANKRYNFENKLAALLKQKCWSRAQRVCDMRLSDGMRAKLNFDAGKGCTIEDEC